MSRTGTLSYVIDDKTYAHELYINELTQALQLSGNTEQSRLARPFYPRSAAPGDYVVSGSCMAEAEYQRPALFVRRRHRALINVPNDARLARLHTRHPRYYRLMRLSIPRQDIPVRGSIQKFTINKQRLFE